MAKYARKITRKVKNVIKRQPRRIVKGVTSSSLNMVKNQVSRLTKMLNAEKKIYQLNGTDGTCAQCVGNAAAVYVNTINPEVSQGVTSSSRIGNSIKVHSGRIKIQLQGQSAMNGDIRVRGYIVLVKGTPYANGTAFHQAFLRPNSFVTGGTIYDYNSDRREDTFKHFRVIRSFSTIVKAPQITGQIAINTLSVGLKFKNYHVRYASDGSNAIADGQLWLLMVADNGNSSTSVNSTLVGTAQTAHSTGLIVQQDTTMWFYDN